MIVRLETEKYDLEERQKRQDYDVSNTFKITTRVPLSRLRHKYHFPDYNVRNTI